MSAAGAAETFVEHWRAGSYRFGIINFANPDMVGHTGVIPAAVAAVETVDAQLGKVVEAVLEKGGACIVTADHGNCDHMLEPDGSPNTAHSLNPVPLIVTAEGARAARPRHPRRRRSDRAAAARHRPARGDDRPLPPRLSPKLAVPLSVQGRTKEPQDLNWAVISIPRFLCPDTPDKGTATLAGLRIDLTIRRDLDFIICPM